MIGRVKGRGGDGDRKSEGKVTVTRRVKGGVVVRRAMGGVILGGGKGDGDGYRKSDGSGGEDGDRTFAGTLSRKQRDSCAPT